MALKIRRLSNALGAEILELDLARPLSADQVADVKQAFLDHQVLLFRNQDLQPAQQIAFSRLFGELDIHPFTKYTLPEHPEILLITNHLMDGKPSDTRNTGRQWHSDLTFTPCPALGSLLYCREIPEVGGNTMFANMYQAYDDLSPAYREMIDGLWAVHDMAIGRDLKNRDPKYMEEMRRKNPPVAQPVVRVHPETGRKALYVNPMVTRNIEHMTDEESRPILEYLFEHASTYEYTYRHEWRVNDLLMWDNRCTSHIALADYDHSSPRHMMRTQIHGEPIGRVLQRQ